MKLRFAEPGFCVKESLGKAQFLRPENSPAVAFLSLFWFFNAGFRWMAGCRKKLGRPGETVVLLAEVSPTVAKGRPSFWHQRNET
ncbi:MAG: hypothetical protein JKX86_00925 [Verrucomicrobiales bacterium]|nr:hypothetical protein [Verrucomicrobiales bacterium]